MKRLSEAIALKAFTHPRALSFGNDSALSFGNDSVQCLYALANNVENSKLKKQNKTKRCDNGWFEDFIPSSR